MDRYSVVGRWDDIWFTSLKPYDKLVFSYLCDKCDEAGFIEVNYKLWELHLGLNKDEIKVCIFNLQKMLLSDKKSKLWVKSHLFWQRKLPLDTNDKEHLWIISKIKANIEKFNNHKDLKTIIDDIEKQIEESKNKKAPAKKSASTTRNNFAAPSYEDFRVYFLTQKEHAEEDEILNLYDYYISRDWKVGNKKMSDWEAAIRVCIRRNNTTKPKFNNYKKESDNKSRSNVTFQVVNDMTGEKNNN